MNLDRDREAPRAEPTVRAATSLIMNLVRVSQSLAFYLTAKSADLPRDPNDAQIVLAARWPALTVEERRMAMRLAIDVLRETAADCEREAATLEALMGEASNG